MVGLSWHDVADGYAHTIGPMGILFAKERAAAVNTKVVKHIIRTLGVDPCVHLEMCRFEA